MKFIIRAFCQASVTSTVTTVLTAFTSFGLAAVSTWFASERWAFSRHKGQKWLSDILYEANQRFLMLPGVTWMRRVLYASRRQLREINRAVLLPALRITGCIHLCPDSGKHEDDDDDDLEASTLPTSARLPYSTYYSKDGMNLTKCGISEATGTSTPIASEVSLAPPPAVFAPSLVGSPDESAVIPAISSATTGPNGTTLGKQLWKNAVRNVRMRSALTTPTSPTSVTTVINQPRSEPRRQRTTSSDVVFPARKHNSGESVPFTRSRVSALVPKLVELEATHDLAAHTALVRHMQFSPDGKYLATSRCVLIILYDRPAFLNLWLPL